MRTTPLTATIGAEVAGVDLDAGVSKGQAEAIYELLLDRAVLVFRDQSPSSAAHLALGEAFGELAPRHPLYPCVDGYEQIMVIRNDERTPPENESWHSDLSFKPGPPFASILHGCVIPPAGGDTLWADMRAVHDALSDPVRGLLASLTAEHSLEYGFSYLRGTDQTERIQALNVSDRRATTTQHPVLKRHPASGRMMVYVNEAFTSHINGVTAPESRALLGALFDLVRHPRFHVRVRWRAGTVVMWDNWATQHFACGDHYPQVREVRRVTVAANRRSGPFGPADHPRGA